MNLVIDIGNTSVKAALFKENNLVKVIVFQKKKLLEQVKKIISENKIAKAILSSVAIITEKEKGQLLHLFPFVVLSSATDVPFINLYQTPETLGVDRIALIAAAVKEYPNRNVLVIDAGTCITFDFVNSKKQYLGGAISPGMVMRYKALHTFTSKLPLLSAIAPEQFIGNNTETAIHTGIINGICNEITGTVAQYELKHSNLIVVLTGGDAYFFAKRLKSSIFANPNFTLEGLHTILIHNQD